MERFLVLLGHLFRLAHYDPYKLISFTSYLHQKFMIGKHLHKMVTSKAGDLVGNVDAVDDTSVLVSTEGARTHYKIPKPMVEGYHHSVSLKVEKDELERFRSNRGEGFGNVK